MKLKKILCYPLAILMAVVLGILIAVSACYFCRKWQMNLNDYFQAVVIYNLWRRKSWWRLEKEEVQRWLGLQHSMAFALRLTKAEALHTAFAHH